MKAWQAAPLTAMLSAAAVASLAVPGFLLSPVDLNLCVRRRAAMSAIWL